MLEGGMVTLGALVAPILFKNIKSADQAGRIFGKILGAWFWVGLACTVILLLSSLVTLINNKSGRRLYFARSFVLVPMLGLIIAFGLVLNRIEAIQSSLTKPIEEYALEANPRLEFDQLHKLSTNLLSINLFLGLGWLVLSAILAAGHRKTSQNLEKLASSETPENAGIGV